MDVSHGVGVVNHNFDALVDLVPEAAALSSLASHQGELARRVDVRDDRAVFQATGDAQVVRNCRILLAGVAMTITVAFMGLVFEVPECTTNQWLRIWMYKPKTSVRTTKKGAKLKKDPAVL